MATTAAARQQAPDATPWEMLRAQLESFIAGQNSGISLAGLQIVTTPTDALWDDTSFGTWLGWEQWANAIPIFGPTYQRSVGNRATDAYFQILTNIDVPDTTDEAAKTKADGLRVQIDAIQQQIAVLQEDMGPAWSTFHAKQKDLPPNRQTTFDAWYAQNYGAKISALTTQMQGLMGAFASASNQAGGGYQLLGQAIMNFNNPAFQQQETDDSGATLAYRTWSLQPKLAKWVKEAKKGVATALDLTIDTSSKTSTKTEWGASAKANWLYGLFSFGGSGSGKHSNVDTTSKDFQMSWKAKAFTTLGITAGQWYNQQILQTFKDGPWLPKGPFGSKKAVPYGEGGVYALQPSAICVAYQPSVTATVDQTAFNEVKSSWEAGATIGIGPFSFGGTTSGSKDDAKFDSAKRSFTVESASPHPQVVAVINNVMPGN